MKFDKEKILQDLQDEIDYIESLDEMATVCRSQQKRMLIQVNPAETRGGNVPYFKLFDSFNESNATRIARIRFDLPLYEIHSRQYNRGKDYWWLNSREKLKLIDYLEDTNTNLSQFTNWEVAILAFNNERGLDYQKTQENLLSKGKLTYPNYIPFDLPMPDYTLLVPDERTNDQIKNAIKGKSLKEIKVIIGRILKN